jgi:hypothetical protein
MLFLRSASFNMAVEPFDYNGDTYFHIANFFSEIRLDAIDRCPFGTGSSPPRDFATSRDRW